MYIDGNLKGGFQTVKAYAEFCAKFKSWMEEKSMKIWPPRLGEIMAQDYRSALDYVNKSVSLAFFFVYFVMILPLNVNFNVFADNIFIFE